MLQKADRIVKTNHFSLVKEKGRVIQSASFGLSYLKKGTEPSKFGIIVSTKVSKKAVERNRVKRMIKEIVAGFKGRVNGGYDIVFLTKSKALQVSKEALEKEIERTLNEGGLLR